MRSRDVLTGFAQHVTSLLLHSLNIFGVMIARTMRMRKKNNFHNNTTTVGTGLFIPRGFFHFRKYWQNLRKWGLRMPIWNVSVTNVMFTINLLLKGDLILSSLLVLHLFLSLRFSTGSLHAFMNDAWNIHNRYVHWLLLIMFRLEKRKKTSDICAHFAWIGVVMKSNNETIQF